ncbi:flagellar outer arm dynein light chain [Micromonas pusilla CCMP1545]|uniref:Flagellar outer arm dynein light chain n=1 Tax=Micromonas pusilla (strain CCMP1545) TaxID=564608 RepID=C1MZK1_MICPC|nr:flagellar outer arm dynein light chain [Micromonas pusilla CCMP1545]EEH54883.1 flagellar outer arm dynein light chain [Micromonas pusilla CCMP1545]|eukprot:XP_003061233.1 flagellar outer arm dynein light chain [Micromonas pusilla CCMP1545]
MGGLDEETGLISGLREDQLITNEEMDTIVRECIESAVGTNSFLHSKVNQWTSNVVEGCLKKLAGLQKPFKYIVTCNFVQKTGGGMHTASTALWDAAVDGKHTVLWESQTIQCIATVYWLAI